MSRLIDADALKNDHHMGDECDKCETKWRECQYDYIYSKMDFCTWIDDAPTVDAVEVVRCKYCKWWDKVDNIDGVNYGTCERKCTAIRQDAFPNENWFCADGQKMDGKEFEEPTINPCRGCEDYDGYGGCKSNGGCGRTEMDGERRNDGQIQQSN